MQIRTYLTEQLQQLLQQQFSLDIPAEDLLINVTRPEFAGEYTLVVFPLQGRLKMSPPQAAQAIGEAAKAQLRIRDYNVVKGFLNLSLDPSLWLEFLEEVKTSDNYGQHPRKDSTVMVEFSSPNTNKPLHLGHIRNILLGWSMYEILSAAGHRVLRTQIINDRGIAICKSMLAWQKWGQGSTPASTQTKGDHFVGDYYVRFENEFRREFQAWQQTEEAQAVFETQHRPDETKTTFFARYKNEYVNTASTLGKEAREMLIRWENNDPDTMDLWRQMNGWVYEGFDATYERLGVAFDHIYYE